MQDAPHGFVADGYERLRDGVRQEVTLKAQPSQGFNEDSADAKTIAEALEKKIEARMSELDSGRNLY